MKQVQAVETLSLFFVSSVEKEFKSKYLMPHQKKSKRSLDSYFFMLLLEVHSTPANIYSVFTEILNCCKQWYLYIFVNIYIFFPHHSVDLCGLPKKHLIYASS